MKILIIEDRTIRQENFTAHSNVDLNSYDFLDNATGSKYQEVYEQLLKDDTVLQPYSIIITHRSAFGKDGGVILSRIVEHCKKNEKKMVLFSGGISAKTYSLNPCETLIINSKDLYSDDLKLFFENIETEGVANLLLLAYGKDWKINLMLNSLEKLNLFLQSIDSDEEIYFDEVIDETGINLLNELPFIPNENDIDTIGIDELESIKRKLKNEILVRLEFA